MSVAAVQKQPWKFPGIPGPEPASALGKEDTASQSIKSPEWEEGARGTKSVVKRNESRQLATVECRLCRTASFIGAQTGGRFMLSKKPNWKLSTSLNPASRLLLPMLGGVCSHPEIHCFPSPLSPPSFFLSTLPSLPSFTAQHFPLPMAGLVP